MNPTLPGTERALSRFATAGSAATTSFGAVARPPSILHACRTPMSFLMTFLVAVKALRRNALRTALTALGMIIGVAAVIVMVAIGTGAQASIEAQIQSAGSNLVI